MEVVASLFQGRTAAAQCGLFTNKSVPVIFEPPCTQGRQFYLYQQQQQKQQRENIQSTIVNSFCTGLSVVSNNIQKPGYYFF